MTRGCLALALAALVACGGAGPTRSTTPGPVRDGTWVALDGGELRLSELRGQVVIVNLFATWSPATAFELELLSEADAAPDVIVVGVAVDPDGRALVAPWRAGSGVRYLIALADDATRAGAGPLGRLDAVPTTVVLDRSGREIARLSRQLDRAWLDEALARARAAGSP